MTARRGDHPHLSLTPLPPPDSVPPPLFMSTCLGINTLVPNSPFAKKANSERLDVPSIHTVRVRKYSRKKAVPELTSDQDNRIKIRLQTCIIMSPIQG